MSQNIIVLNRGDTFTFDFNISDITSTDGKYHLKTNDAVYFGIMDPHQKFEDALVKKKYIKTDMSTAGNIAIEITPDDTLDLVPGIYYYSIKLYKAATVIPESLEEVITVINKTKLILKK